MEELLEKAAKAAGYEFGHSERLGKTWIRRTWVDENDGNCSACVDWNPLESDADAFRLMIDAKINVHPGRMVVAWHPSMEEAASVEITEYEDDQVNITRHAIVKAAAAKATATQRIKGDEG